MQNLIYFLYVIYMTESNNIDPKFYGGELSDHAKNDNEIQFHAGISHKRKHEETISNSTCTINNNCFSETIINSFVENKEYKYLDDYINNFFEHFVDFLNKNIFRIIIRLVTEINGSNLRLIILEKYQIVNDVLLPQNKGPLQIESRTIRYVFKNSDNTMYDKYIIYGDLVYHTWLFLRENPNITFEATKNIYKKYNVFTNFTQFIDQLSNDMHEDEFLSFFESLDKEIIITTITEILLYKEKYDPLGSYCCLLKKFCFLVIKILLDKWRKNGANILEYNLDNQNYGIIINCKYEVNWKMITTLEMETKIKAFDKSMTSLKKTQENKLINVPKILENVKKGIKEQTTTYIILDFKLNETILSSVLDCLDYLVVHTEINLQTENLEKHFFNNHKISAFIDAFELLLIELKKMIAESICNNEIKKEDVEISIFMFDVVLLENYFKNAKYSYITQRIRNQLTHNKIYALCNKIKMDFYTKLLQKTFKNRFLSCILYLFDFKDLGNIIKENHLIFNDIANDHTYNHCNSQMLDYTIEAKKFSGQGLKFMRFFDQSLFGHILDASSIINSNEYYADLVFGEREIKNKKRNSFTIATETMTNYDEYKNIKPMETNKTYINSQEHNCYESHNMNIQASSVPFVESSCDKTRLSIEQEHYDATNFNSANYIQSESLQDKSFKANETVQTDKHEDLTKKDIREKKAKYYSASEIDTDQFIYPNKSHAESLNHHFDQNSQAIQNDNVKATEQNYRLELKRLEKQYLLNDSNFQNEQEKTRQNYLFKKDKIIYQQSLLREQHKKLRSVYIQKQEEANNDHNLREQIFNQKLKGLQEQISTHKNQHQKNHDYFIIMSNLYESLKILEENFRYEHYTKLIIYYDDELDFANKQHIYNEKKFEFEKQLLIIRNEFNKRSFEIEKKFKSEQKLLRIKYHSLEKQIITADNRYFDQRK